jgi:hypothetical protein
LDYCLTFSAGRILISDCYGTSRLLAALSICSSKPSGRRIEIAVVESYFGKCTRSALLLSMLSVGDRRFAEFSFFGFGLEGRNDLSLLIDSPLLTVHISIRTLRSLRSHNQ